MYQNPEHTEVIKAFSKVIIHKQYEKFIWLPSKWLSNSKSLLMNNTPNDQIHIMCFININRWGYFIVSTNEEINSDHSIMIISMTEQNGWHLKKGESFSREHNFFFFKNIYLTYR